MAKKQKEKPKMGRPLSIPNLEQLRALMRVSPTLADTAAFFQCSERVVERTIAKNFNNLTFTEFREQNAVFSRLNIRRKMIQKAEAGDNTMLIWCSKNLLGWTDRQETVLAVSEIKITKDEENL